MMLDYSTSYSLDTKSELYLSFDFSLVVHGYEKSSYFVLYSDDTWTKWLELEDF